MGRVPSVNRNQKASLVPAGTTIGAARPGSAARALVVVTAAVSRGAQSPAARMSLVEVPKSAMEPARALTVTAKKEAPEG